MRSRREIKALAKEAIRGQRGTAILLCLIVMVVTYVSIAIDWAVLWITGSLGLFWLVYWVGMLVIWIAYINQSGEYVKLYQRQQASAGQVFAGFGVNFARKLGGSLWMFLWLFLWGLIAFPVILIGALVVGIAAWTTGGVAVDASLVLFFLLTIAAFIPMIIKSLAYSQMYYILATCPEVQATEALRLSRRMTKGHKGKVFLMGLSFIGWSLLISVPAIILGVVYELELIPGFNWIALMVLSSLVTLILYIPFLAPYIYTSYAGLFIELRDNAIAEGTIMREEFGMQAEEEQVMEPNRYREGGEGYGSGLGVGMKD